MKKTLCIIFLIILAGAILCFSTLKSEETQPIQKSSEFPAIESPQVSRQSDEKADSDILTDIRRAQLLLEKQEAGFLIQEKVVKGKKIKKWEIKDFRVLVAVQHSDKRIQIISVDPKAKKSDPPEYIIDWSRANGVNTDFTIVQPEGCIVLAIKRVVSDENAGDLFKEVVYTPYTPEIDCKILRDAGLSYLKKVIQMARADLRQVSSQVHPEYSVAETATEDLALALVLAIIEHIDPDRMKKEKIEQLMNEVLVIIGANQAHAYRYAVSKKNARGLFQFIPLTYKSICKKYQEAQLNQDFVEGMNNHLNAAKASLLLFDSDLSNLNKKGQKKYMQTDSGTRGKYLASAYNCGVDRTIGAIRSYKGLWEQKVPAQTRAYLKKFSAVWNLLIGA